MIDLWSTILAVVVDVLVRLALLRIGPAFPANATEWPPPSTLVAKWRMQANGDPPRQSPKRRCGPQLSLLTVTDAYQRRGQRATLPFTIGGIHIPFFWRSSVLACHHHRDINLLLILAADDEP